MALKPSSSAGFSTGSKLVIIAMVSFFLLGYSVFLSICLGAIAGVTGGFIASWWNAKEDYITDEITDEPVAATATSDGAKAVLPARSRPRRYGVGVIPARRARPRRAVRRFGWLFRRNR